MLLHRFHTTSIQTTLADQINPAQAKALIEIATQQQSFVNGISHKKSSSVQHSGDEFVNVVCVSVVITVQYKH
jgi:hypothetical protein